MLKITLLPSSDQTEAITRLILEGRLEGAWVGELSRVWDGLRRSCGAIVEVNLSGVSYASESGARLLRAMRVQGAALTADSSLAKSWIEDQIGSSTKRFAR